jgi:hypothetical protein
LHERVDAIGQDHRTLALRDREEGSPIRPSRGPEVNQILNVVTALEEGERNLGRSVTLLDMSDQQIDD